MTQSPFCSFFSLGTEKSQEKGKGWFKAFCEWYYQTSSVSEDRQANYREQNNLQLSIRAAALYGALTLL